MTTDEIETMVTKTMGRLANANKAGTCHGIHSNGCCFLTEIRRGDCYWVPDPKSSWPHVRFSSDIVRPKRLCLSCVKSLCKELSDTFESIVLTHEMWAYKASFRETATYAQLDCFDENFNRIKYEVCSLRSKPNALVTTHIFSDDPKTRKIKYVIDFYKNVKLEALTR